MFHSPSRFTLFALFVLTVVGFAVAQPGPGVRYEITAIGPLPGDWRSTAIAINESGRVAGISFNETYPGALYTQWPPFPDTTLGFLWDNGALTPLLPPAGYQGSWVYGLHNMNANGQVVGTAAKVDPDLPGLPGWNGHPVLVGKVPVLWNQRGVPRILTLPEGYSEGSAWAINNRGQVVGFAGNDLGLDTPLEYWMLQESLVAVLWDKDLKPKVLPFLPAFEGGRCGIASINDAGQIIGGCATLDYATSHAVMWDKGQVIDLTPWETGYSEADGINNRGQVVGYSDSFGFGFLWENGVLTSLGAIENDVWSWALSINNKGQVVGQSSGPEGDLFGRAFLWEKGKMYDLNALFDDPNDEWLVTWGYSINDRGEIVGFGLRTDSNGEYQSTGFLLTPKR